MRAERESRSPKSCRTRLPAHRDLFPNISVEPERHRQGVRPQAHRAGDHTKGGAGKPGPGPRRAVGGHVASAAPHSWRQTEQQNCGHKREQQQQPVQPKLKLRMQPGRVKPGCDIEQCRIRWYGIRYRSPKRTPDPQSTPSDTNAEKRKPHTKRVVAVDEVSSRTNKSSALIETARNNTNNRSRIDRPSSQTLPQAQDPHADGRQNERVARQAACQQPAIARLVPVFRTRPESCRASGPH